MANEISKLITPDGVSHDIKDSVARQASYDVSNKVSKTGDTMTGNLKLESSSNNGIIFKESGYGDKFEIKPSFSGTDDTNYLALKTATGAAGTDPDTKEKIRIRPSGNVEMIGSLKLLGSELNLKTPDSSSNDSGDIVWHYGNGQEKARIWTGDNPTGYGESRLNFRSYKSDGSALHNTQLATASDVDGKLAKAGDTMTGALTMNNVDMVVKDTDIKLGTTPSSNIWGNGYYFQTNDGTSLGYLREVQDTSNKAGLQLEIQRTISNTRYYQYLMMKIDGNGSKSVDMSDPAAWRSAIGHPFVWDINTKNTTDTWVPVLTGSTVQHRVIPTTIAGTTEQSYTRNHSSVSYTEHLRCWRFGNVITLGGYFSCSGSIAANTLLYTLPSPKFIIYFTAKHETQNRMYNFNLQTNGQLKTNEAIAGGNYLVCFTYVCA